ncbi:hypothetical protein GUK36_41465, partial [Rhizobium leguminosarum]
MIDTFRWVQSSLASTRIVESEHALVSPKDAISDDMRCMVEDLQRFGQIHKTPGAYSLADGTMIVHPHFYAALKRRFAEKLEAQSDRMFMTAM